MFLSQRPNNDPQPFDIPNTYDALTGEGNVRLSEKSDGAVLAPRSQFTQTRDKAPWLLKDSEFQQRYQSSKDELSQSFGARATVCWAPRHEEFDTPVNPILAEFRSTWTSNYREGAQNWLIYIDGSWGIKSIEHSTVQQRDHARRVLHLLAVISE